MSTWNLGVDVLPTTTATYKLGSSTAQFVVNGYTLNDAVEGNCKIYKGSCSTAASTATKAVSCTGYTTLTVGDIIFVVFSSTNTAAVSSLKLNVSSTGAKSIKYRVNNTLSDLPAAAYLSANQTHMFIYDGTNWVMSDNTTSIASTDDINALFT